MRKRSRIHAFALGALVALTTTGLAGASEAALLVRNVTVISPDRPAPLRRADVLIREGRIERVGHRLDGAGARTIDGTNRFLIPGLIDSHVHIKPMLVVDDDTADRQPELLAAYREQLPRAYLAFGFTTLVDLDFDPASRKWFDSQPLHPRLYGCGPGIRIAAGYMARRVTKDAKLERIPNLVHEPSQSDQWPDMLDPRDYSPAHAVERAAAADSICVKVFYESGFGGMFNWPVPRAETLLALHQEAAARKLPMVMHANAIDAWRAAAAADTDIIAHGLWQWPGERSDPTPPPAAWEVIDEVARKRIHVQATTRAVCGTKSVFDLRLLDDPRLSLSLPRNIIDYLHAGTGSASLKAIQDSYLGAAANAPQLIDNGCQSAVATLRRMNEKGVRLILGTDTPSVEGIGNPPGLNGRLELQHWADAGIAPLEILRAATLENAEALGLAREIGSIEPGKRADLLLLSDDPLRNVAAYDSIELVILGGTVVSREELRPK